MFYELSPAKIKSNNLRKNGFAFFFKKKKKKYLMWAVVASIFNKVHIIQSYKNGKQYTVL